MIAHLTLLDDGIFHEVRNIVPHGDGAEAISTACPHSAKLPVARFQFLVVEDEALARGATLDVDLDVAHFDGWFGKVR